MLLRLPLLLVLAVLPLLAGCASITRPLGLGPDPGEYDVAKGDTAEEMYEKARYHFAGENWKVAEDAFRVLWTTHPTHELAGDARFYQAECRYGREKYNGAFTLYKEYLKSHPLSPHGPLIQRRLYDMGTYVIEDGKNGFLGIFTFSGEGVEYLEYLVSSFPNGDLADDALMYMATFEQEDDLLLDAREHLLELLHFYPGSEWALDARLRLARVFRGLNRGANYDADVLHRSLAEYRAYIELVERDPERAAEYQDMLASARDEAHAVVELLAEKSLEMADYYLRTDKAEAAKAELQNLVREYPDTRAAMQARALLGIDTATNGEAP